MAASVVLLHNANNLLPLRLQGKTVAIIGPFADCFLSSSDDGPGDAPDASTCTYLVCYLITIAWRIAMARHSFFSAIAALL